MDLEKKIREKVYVDTHVHAYEYDSTELTSMLQKNIIIVSVSEDIETSKKTLFLHEENNRIIPCIGIHPWVVEKTSINDAKIIERLLEEMRRPCIGEVGLDRKFVPETFDRQKKFFEIFITMAQEYDAIINLHAAGAWREVFEYINRNDIETAIFHWYTGPLDLLKNIVEREYYLSINVAAQIQEKHKKVVEQTPISLILTESDGPYNYRGLKLSPTMIPSLIDLISKIKNKGKDEILRKVNENFTKIFFK